MKTQFYLVILVFILIGYAHGKEVDELLLNGGFENVGDDGLPEHWAINETYPGDVKVIKKAGQAHGGQRYLKMIEPPGAKGGAAIRFKKSISKKSADYGFTCYARGNGKLTLALATWDKSRFLVTVAGHALPLDDAEKWQRYEGTINIPEKVKPVRRQTDDPDELNEQLEGVEVAGFIPMVFIYGNVDVDDISLSEKSSP